MDFAMRGGALSNTILRNFSARGGIPPPPFAKFFGFLFFVDLGSIQETLLKISGKKSQTRAKNCVFALDTAKMGHKKA